MWKAVDGRVWKALECIPGVILNHAGKRQTAQLFFFPQHNQSLRWTVVGCSSCRTQGRERIPSSSGCSNFTVKIFTRIMIDFCLLGWSATSENRSFAVGRRTMEWRCWVIISRVMDWGGGIQKGKEREKRKRRVNELIVIITNLVQ